MARRAKKRPANWRLILALLAAGTLIGLLADARQMGLDDPADASPLAGGKEAEAGFSIPQSVRNAISTIITVDFFVVCGFLVWFLAGIFCSSVLEDDTVQIAFNSNFETLVQPALGILMIAAIAGNFFKEEEEEQ